MGRSHGPGACHSRAKRGGGSWPEPPFGSIGSRAPDPPESRKCGENSVTGAWTPTCTYMLREGTSTGRSYPRQPSTAAFNRRFEGRDVQEPAQPGTVLCTMRCKGLAQTPAGRADNPRKSE